MGNISIRLIEDHDQAYYFWKELGVSNRPLVHLDAHIDFNFHPAKPVRQTFAEARSKDDLVRQLSTNLMYRELKIKEKALTNIGNYIYPAMRDGMVSDFYWVIPGDRKEFRRSAKNLRNILMSFFRRDPFETRGITREDGALKGRVYGRNFCFTTLDALPENIDGALLDIDTDYLTTGTIRRSGAGQDAGKRSPWIWPEELVGRLKEKGVRPSCMTVSYSVNGGFTPLIYKFLGDEVAIFSGEPDGAFRDLISEKNGAIGSFNRGEVRSAAAGLKRILKEADRLKADPGLKKRFKAHISFLLFRCSARMKDRAGTGVYYRSAVRLDKTYRARDNNYGPLYLSRAADIRKAEQEFRLILSVDGNNSYALAGLANIARRRRKNRMALALYKKALKYNRKNRDALLGLCRAELSSKNYRSVLKRLEGLKGAGLTRGAVHSMLARAYEGLGRTDEALESYRMAHRFGMDLDLYVTLLRLLRKTGIPEKHKEWIRGRIDAYRDFRKKALKTPRGRAVGAVAGRAARMDARRLKKQQARQMRLITGIDAMLKGIEKALWLRGNKTEVRGAAERS